jgi:hypothetical protein
MRMLVMAGACVWGFSQLFLVLGGGAIALTWIGVSIAKPQVFNTPRVRWCWWAVPAIGLLAAVLAVTNVGLTIRVWLSDAELREFAEAVIADHDHRKTTPRRVGLLVVRSAGVEGRQVYLQTASGFLDVAGVVYCPDGDVPLYADRHSQLFGPWWWFWEDF